MSKNVIKVGVANDSFSIQEGPFAVGAVGITDYGPTSRTNYYAAIDVPTGGYVFYHVDNLGKITAQVANDDTQALYFLKSYGATGTTLYDALTWIGNQSNYFSSNVDISKDTIIAANSGLNVTPTPTPTPSSTSTPTPTPTPTPSSTSTPTPTPTPSSTPTSIAGCEFHSIINSSCSFHPVLTEVTDIFNT